MIEGVIGPDLIVLAEVVGPALHNMAQSRLTSHLLATSNRLQTAEYSFEPKLGLSLTWLPKVEVRKRF